MTYQAKRWNRKKTNDGYGPVRKLGPAEHGPAEAMLHAEQVAGHKLTWVKARDMYNEHDIWTADDGDVVDSTRRGFHPPSRLPAQRYAVHPVL